MHFLTNIFFIFLLSYYAYAKNKNSETLDNFYLGHESVDNLLKDPDLLYLLKKRIHEDSSEDYKDVCSIEKSISNAIIKTNASLEAGAKFLYSPELTTLSCSEECCALDGCNTAIVKDENSHKRACYLFNCGTPNVCIFDSHDSFRVERVNTDSRVVSIGDANNSNQEDNEVKLVELEGRCRHNEDCAQKNGGTICDARECSCNKGYHQVSNNCRKNCVSKYDFECLNIERPTHSECIAIYNRCDKKSIEQCSDGSDEINCTRKGIPVTKTSTPSISSVSTTTTTIIVTTTTNNNQVVMQEFINPNFLQINKMAVVALAAGLALTLVAVVMALCRLKECRRRRARKLRLKAGLGGDDQDADYLINGMYL